MTPLVCRSCGLVFEASETQAAILESAARMMGGDPGRELMECDGCKGRRSAPAMPTPQPSREPGCDDDDEDSYGSRKDLDL